MRCDVLAVDDPRWHDVLRTTRHSVYHLPEFVAIEARRSGCPGGAILISDNKRWLLLPYLVRRGPVGGNSRVEDARDVVSPYGYPGILPSDATVSDDGFLGAALESTAAYFAGQGFCTAFLRQHPLLSPALQNVSLPGFALRTVPHVVVPLDRSVQEIWARTRKGHQSTINRCTRLGHTARLGSWAEHRSAFLEIYRETMDHAGAAGDYYFDEAYFEALQHLDGHVHLGIVESGGEVAAACLFFESCGIVHAHLGGTRERYRAQSPFSLLLHFARLWARERGNHVLHLGGGVGGAEDAVFHFKAGFSRDRVEYVTTHWVIDRDRYDHLVDLHASAIGLRSDALLATGFFPAYRANA